MLRSGVAHLSRTGSNRSANARHEARGDRKIARCLAPCDLSGDFPHLSGRGRQQQRAIDALGRKGRRGRGIAARALGVKLLKVRRKIQLNPDFFKVASACVTCSIRVARPRFRGDSTACDANRVRGAVAAILWLCWTEAETYRHADQHGCDQDVVHLTMASAGSIHKFSADSRQYWDYVTKTQAAVGRSRGSGCGVIPAGLMVTTRGQGHCGPPQPPAVANQRVLKTPN